MEKQTAKVFPTLVNGYKMLIVLKVIMQANMVVLLLIKIY